MALNVEQALADRLWELLEDRDGVTDAIGPGGFHKRSEANGGGRKRDALQTNASHYPSLGLTIASGADQRPPLTFGSRLGPNECDFGVPMTYSLTLTLKQATDTETTQTALETEIEAALRSAGVTLGLPWVGLMTIRKTRAEAPRNQPDERVKLTVTYAIAAECRPLLSALVEE